MWTEKRETNSWLRFIELSPFGRRRSELGFDDDDVREIQVQILLDPRDWPVMAGTGGVRKMRFARRSEGRGRSGSYRILYVYFERAGTVALVTAYGKNEQGNIDAADRKLFRRLVETVERGLAARE